MIVVGAGPAGLAAAVTLQQLLAVALKRAPERLMNPLSAALRRITVPDLGSHGLPAPAGDGLTQFLRTRTVPILDHGFVRAVRSGAIKVVPAVDRFGGTEVRLSDARVLRPDAVICATGYRPGLEELVGHLDVLDASGLPRGRAGAALPSAPGLHFVGMAVEPGGLLREIAREAQAVARSVPEGSAGPPTAASPTLGQ